MTFPLIIGASSQKRSSRPLYMKWRTTTSNETVTLPLPNAAGVNYNFIIDWGDGHVSQITAYNDSDRIHTYATVGDHISRISGTCEGWSFNNTGDKAKLIEVYGGKDHVFKYMAGAFFGCTNLTLADIGGWDISNCTNFNGTFQSCTSLTSLNLSAWNFNTSVPITFANFFSSCSNLTTVGDTGNWNVSNVNSMQGLFHNCSKLSSINTTNWDVSSVTSLRSAFQGCTSLTALDVSNWDVSKVTTWGSSSVYGCFLGCTGLTSLDVSGWTFSTVSNINFIGTFSGCTGLTTLDVSSWNTSKFLSASYAFNGCTNLTSLDVSGWDTSNCTSLTGTFQNCQKLATIDVSTWNVTNCTSLALLFSGCYVVNALDVSGWNVTKNTSFSGTFAECRLVTTLDVSGWVLNTTANLDLSQMFSRCYALSTLDVSGWNTSKVTSLFATFLYTSSLVTLDVSGWDTSNVTSMAITFMYCAATTLDVSAWNVSKVVIMYNAGGGMFAYCSVTALDLSGWVFNAALTNLRGFCLNCSALTTIGDVSGWDTSHVTNFFEAFRNTGLTSIDMSGWDMSLVTISDFMFNNCQSLTSITLPASFQEIDNEFATRCSSIALYNLYQPTAPTIVGTPFGNYAKPLHVPVANSGYDVAPWTNTAIFSSIINDL